MHSYCKAYLLGDIRQFAGWAEHSSDAAQHLTDDEVCFLWDDFTVVTNPIQGGETLLASVTPEWQSFCETALQFSPPSPQS